MWTHLPETAQHLPKTWGVGELFFLHRMGRKAHNDPTPLTFGQKKSSGWDFTIRIGPGPGGPGSRGGRLGPLGECTPCEGVQGIGWMHHKNTNVPHKKNGMHRIVKSPTPTGS